MVNEDNYWSRRAANGRMNRRRFVGTAALAAAGASTLGLIGCGDDSTSGGGQPTASAAATPTPAPSSADAAVKKGGIFNFGATGPLSGVDPHTSVYNGATTVPTVYNYLFRAQNTPDQAVARGITYDLAESHKLEADKITYTFKLRNNVKIAPNKYNVPERMLDADDVKASFDRVADKATAASGYGFMQAYVDKYDMPDKQTFRLIMKAPYAWTDSAIGDPLFLTVVPKEWLGNADVKKDAVGAGPFVLKELTEGQISRMERNPNYYRPGKPNLDAWNNKQFADQATFRTAFQSGQVDFYVPTNHDESLELKKSEPSITVFSDPSLGFNSFWMKVTEKPWDDPRVRKAVSLAINRQEYIDLIGHGVGEPIGPLTYAFTKEALPKDELMKLQPFDVAQAKALFQQAGVTSFQFSYPTSSNMPDYANIFIRQMSAAGVTTKPEPLDAGTWLAGYSKSTLSASLTLNQSYKSPDVALRWFHTGGFTGAGTYWNQWSVPEVDKAIETAAGITDPDARTKAYLELQRLIISKDPPFLNIFGVRDENVLKSYVKNYPGGTGALRTAFFQDIWLDKA